MIKSTLILQWKMKKKKSKSREHQQEFIKQDQPLKNKTTQSLLQNQF